ncbi:Methuselah ectodomain, domain 2,GPCR, family 2-like,GPCR, family 2, secretin-like [Cinara cedri]|uniref:Methuselah ectodomain, domain 2,GPCR, family 2-like,GPCR, family 2, secretin-like n=1 Tax=Cinara cedri TaxID=506608 RepID=A0A5E4NR09_9HEMI|nr:Methuselah ectodomain, domain 2,GPCR, family 2-like,GPCR, family 2, secretin-like [Cinara cedri]
MNAVRSCFAESALLLLFTVVGPNSIVFATVETAAKSSAVVRLTCCSTPGDVGGNPACQYENQTFHRIEIIGGSGFESCPKPYGSGADALQLVQKCCPPDQNYDPETLSCQAVENGQESTNDFQWLMLKMLLLPDRIRDTVTVLGYKYGPTMCQDGEVLIDVVNKSTAIEPLLSEDLNCFDVTPPPGLQLVARKCRPKVPYCDEKSGRYTCVNKCCRGNKIIGSNFRCNETSKKPLNLNIYETTNDGDRLSNRTLLLPYYSRLKCKAKDKYEENKFKLLVNKTLNLIDSGLNLPEGDYCLEYYSENGSNSTKVLALACAPFVKLSEDDTKGSWKYWLILFGFVPSIVCLSITLIVYAMLSTLRNVHGYYVMCYIACLLLSFVCLLIIQWMSDEIHPSLCKFVGYSTLFLLLATFCWLNVICFDIFWILRYNKSINKISSITMRTVIYNIYCWGFSSTWTCTAFIFQHSEHPGLSKFSPDLGTKSCWFSEDNYGSFIFFTLPLSIMLIANLILFGLTAVHCSRIKSELNKFKRTDSKTRRIQLDMEKFAMSVKLFLVMGIPWSFEVLSKVLKTNWFIWYVLDEINALQGVMVFVIFVAKRKVITSLRKKIKGSFDHNESTKVNTISGSSQSSAHHRNFNDF